MMHFLQLLTFHLENRPVPINGFMFNTFSFFSDSITFVSYAWITFLLVMIGRQLPGSFKKFAYMFSALLMLCGLTHLLRAMIIFIPLFDTKIIVQSLCSVVTIWTAIQLTRKRKIITQVLKSVLAFKMDLVENLIEVKKDLSSLRDTTAKK